MTPLDLESFLSGARVDEAVFALRPDYRAALLVVDRIEPGESDAAGDDLLRSAEEAARAALATAPVEELPHIAAWREAYRAFGAKPQRTRNSLESLTRRAVDGLPRVNRLTDIYNAVSVLHQVPLGGEDLRAYVGSPRLVRANGDEPFESLTHGDIVIENPDQGEVIWRDDGGVTCRRWNWRQGRRTQLSDRTTEALFIVDALWPVSDEELTAVVEDLAAHLARLGPDVTTAQTILSATRPGGPRGNPS